MTKLKIVYFTPSSTLYGDNIAILNVIRHLGQNIDVYFITSKKGEFTNKLDELCYPYYFVTFYNNLYPPCSKLFDLILFFPRILRRIVLNKYNLRKSVKIVSLINPDIIHTNNGLIDGGFNTAKKLGIKHIWHIREYADLDIGLKHFPSQISFSKKIQTRNNYIIAITKDILKHYAIINNAVVIFDGVCNSIASPINLTRKKYFLFTGRLCEAKGLELLIHAFAEFSISNNSFNLLIAGTGENKYVSSLSELIKKLAVESKVHFLGYRNDISKLMMHASGLIVTSRYEGFGFITSEAMFNGCLVIGRNTGGTREQFDNGLQRHGKEIGIRYNDIQELISSLILVANNDPSYFLPILKRAQETVVSLYSIEESASKLFSLYKKILST